MRTRVLLDPTNDLDRVFRTVGSLDRAQVVNSSLCAASDAVHAINGSLRMPTKIVVGFSNHEYSYAYGNKIVFGTKQIMSSEASHRAIVGLAAHEISHVSDSTANNFSSQHGWLGFLIEEGKAEQVALELGGQDYDDYFIDPEGIAPNDMLKSIERACNLTKKERRMPGLFDPYVYGMNIVGEVMRNEDASIFEIHPQPFEFFSDKINNIVGKGQVGA